MLLASTTVMLMQTALTRPAVFSALVEVVSVEMESHAQVCTYIILFPVKLMLCFPQTSMNVRAIHAVQMQSALTP